jgi:hypothetical protein
MPSPRAQTLTRSALTAHGSAIFLFPVDESENKQMGIVKLALSLRVKKFKLEEKIHRRDE